VSARRNARRQCEWSGACALRLSRRARRHTPGHCAERLRKGDLPSGKLARAGPCCRAGFVEEAVTTHPLFHCCALRGARARRAGKHAPSSPSPTRRVGGQGWHATGPRGGRLDCDDQCLFVQYWPRGRSQSCSVGGVNIWTSWSPPPACRRTPTCSVGPFGSRSGVPPRVGLLPRLDRKFHLPCASNRHI
jgi:hypothetical protein